MKNLFLLWIVMILCYLAGAITWGNIWGLNTMWSLPFLFVAGIIAGIISAKADRKY